ncbi:choice-of-anchor D domain-containing protein [Luteolibacter flavescens]|uniref:Choice-of-anchor D domain-containing protein n=1 Tax=Luteolibacter flavescens TaxID=1859460 RepID=A0ABT3FXE3_9BACT|nr:choice-of-anchor D domain-containing protein [Luteolibacter flavescens]MCW1887665.1 choice-of-anchor D domain-containing protein [Luteolibacter flavescens]
MRFVDPHPTAGNEFGASVVLLSTGNVVVTAPSSSYNGYRSGSVYLFNGKTGALISELHGSSYQDRIGSDGVTKVGDGNFVIRSQDWDNGSVVNAGAVTWGSGVSGVSGVVSASNSLVGSSLSDRVSNGGLTVLANGNYVVRSSAWKGGAGAVTWGSGATGVSGVVGPEISLVGSKSNDGVGVVTELANGNYVVTSPAWDNGLLTDVGAVTLCSGSAGLAGVVSSANSLVGSKAGDKVGTEVLPLPGGHFVVRSPDWDRDTVIDAGAVTWVHGTEGLTGTITMENSVVGRAAGDRIGTSLAVLGNGHYVIGSTDFDNDGVSNVGAATWMNGGTGTSGVLSAANSLVGSSANDRVGSQVTALTNGNYVVSSPNWSNAGAARAGAATWRPGNAASSGVVSTANSVVGSTASDQVGTNVLPLNNGNYVVSSRFWSNAGASGAGAATWCPGTGVSAATVSPLNSLVGSRTNDNVGALIALRNGNYLVESTDWDNGSIVDAGAVTWGSGTTGISGTVSPSNSLVGASADDKAGFRGISTLPNGNYLVRTASWDNGTAVNAGAVTWGNGVTGTTGPISSSNSLVGSRANESIGQTVRILSNGNYVVASPAWNNGNVANAGAVTWGSGTSGVSGAVSTSNSLVGTSESDAVGASITHLTNGNYVVASRGWDHGQVRNIGAATWCSGLTGLTGPVTAANSITGEAADAGFSSIIPDEDAGVFYAAFVSGGAVTMIPGSLTEGASPRPLVTLAEGSSTLIDGSTSPVSFGDPAVGVGVTKTFTISNPGNADLILGGITREGEHAGDFVVGSPAGMTIAPGGSTTFTITFTPLDAGVRTAVLRIASNAGSPADFFDVLLTGGSAYGKWAQDAGLTGAAAEASATPFGDGVPNLLKYAFNMDGTRPDRRMLTAEGTAGLPLIEVDTSLGVVILHVSYLRRVGSGLIYTPQSSVNLRDFTQMFPNMGNEVVTPINGEWERVTIQHLADEQAKFVRVEVKKP